MADRVKGAADDESPPPSRRERAARTRVRMVQAAHDVFVERGYVGARMTDIARSAGVAVQTLYFTFHTKSELLLACYERAVFGDSDLPPPAQPWWAEMMAAPDGARLLQRFAAGNTGILDRAGRLDEVVRGASHEPDAVTVRAQTERLRREGYATVVDALARFGLAPGLDRETATDVLLSVAGPSTYRAFIVDCGWTSEQYVEWLAPTLAKLLLAPRRRAGSAR